MWQKLQNNYFKEYTLILNQWIPKHDRVYRARVKNFRTVSEWKWIIRSFYFQNERFWYFKISIFLFYFLYLLSKFNPFPLWSYLSFVKPVPPSHLYQTRATRRWCWNVVHFHTDLECCSHCAIIVQKSCKALLLLLHLCCDGSWLHVEVRLFLFYLCC